MGKEIKKWVHNGDKFWKMSFIVAQCISVLLIIASFCIPPSGVIDPSVFAAIGEIFAFPALLSFYNIVMTGKQATLKRGDLEISISDDKKTD